MGWAGWLTHRTTPPPPLVGGIRAGKAGAKAYASAFERNAIAGRAKTIGAGEKEKRASKREGEMKKISKGKRTANEHV